MLRVLTKDELLNLMAGLPPSVMAMDEEETITTLAATVIEQQAEIERLREAMKRARREVMSNKVFAAEKTLLGAMGNEVAYGTRNNILRGATQ